jgi:hypothetical protein
VLVPVSAGKIVRHGRRTFLKINAAMLAVFTAICGCCARLMQARSMHEGGLIPETL